MGPVGAQTAWRTTRLSEPGKLLPVGEPAPFAEAELVFGLELAELVPESHGKQTAGDPYIARHLHMQMDEDGVHAFLRDAALDPEDVLAVAGALYAQAALPQRPLASLMVNGAVVPRPLQRTLRGDVPLHFSGSDAAPFTLYGKGAIEP